MIRSLLVVALVGLAFQQELHAQNVLSVPSTFSTIQGAVNAAQSGDTVSVAAGTYFESVDLLGKAITLQGSGPQSTVIDATGLNAPCLLMIGGEGAGTIVDGFGLTGGTGYLAPGFSSPPYSPGGGGLYLQRGTFLAMSPIDPPVIRNCRFFQFQTLGAVAMNGTEADAVFEDCLFEQNVSVTIFGAPGSGGALFVGGRYLKLDGCTFNSNSAQWGGAINTAVHQLEIFDCLFEGNQAFGGGASDPGTGGAIYGSGLSAVIERCRFLDNATDGDGGALKLVYLSSAASGLQMRSCVIAGNQAPVNSAVFAYGPTVVKNCTFTGNLDSAQIVVGDAPVLFAQASSAATPISITNSIFQGNSPNDFPTSIFGSSVVSYCNIGGGWAGVGNVDVPAGFVDPANGDYRLAFGSPMVNAGDPAAAAGIPFDVEGEPRVLYGLPDIGADECDDIAYHSSSTGTLFDPASPSVSVSSLTVMGDDGGPDRRVTVPLHGTWSLEFDSPDWMTMPPQFAIFGVLGEPAHETVTTLPFGFGEMSFPPCPVLPAYDGLLFTLTSTVAGMPCVTVLPATPGDLTIGPIPGCPIPLDVGFQAFLIDDQGQPQVSNLVIVNIQ